MPRPRHSISAAPFPQASDLFAERKGIASSRLSSADEISTGEILGMPVERFLLSLKAAELEDELWRARRSNATDFIALIGKIQELSQRLFPGPVTMDYACDPEDPTNEYMVFDVVADGGFKDYRDREFQWHDEVEKIVPGVLSEFRLCVHRKP